jgi:sigma-E factor negative regulatory protein RseC
MSATNKSGTINHDGIVQRNNGESVMVSIIASPACSGCHAEGSCSMSGNVEKIIEVHGSYSFIPGDQVTVLMKLSMGYAALFIGYILPVISVICMLAVMIALGVSELLSGLASLAVLILYYVVLFFFRKRLNSKFTLTLKV